jgi:transcriptional regulator with XRE-family HTH domain
MKTQSLADRIRRLRERAGGISPRQADRLADITPNHTYAIEHSKKPRPAAGTIEKIALAFGVSMDWLWTGEGPEPDDDALTSAIAAADRRATDREDREARRAKRSARGAA